MVGKPIDKEVYSIVVSPCYEYVVNSSSGCIVLCVGNDTVPIRL